MGLREVHLLMQKGEYKQALNILDSVTFEDQLDGKILKTELLIENGDLKKAASLAGETLKESRASGTAVQTLKALINQGNILSILVNLLPTEPEQHRVSEPLVFPGRHALSLIFQSVL